MAGQGRKTFVAGDVLLAQELNDYLMDQSVMNFATTAARSSAIPTPTEGMLALTKDNDEIDYYNGSSWVSALPIGAWQTWSPVLSGGFLNGNGVWTAHYAQVGKIVFLSASFVVGSTTTKGTGFTVSLPPPNMVRSIGQLGQSRMSIGGTLYYGYVVPSSASTILMGIFRADSAFLTGANIVGSGGSPVPAIVNTGDSFQFTYVYEAA